ncbi:hypothetical protein RHGRI_031826 [Rhododendron griersonianum]|uniref:Uncharacterized protein n=1 Tax=Rhododendron griersonianum TaxID=479676 RepID=A0AAV6I9S0_9ERIC|nr:hypothetical protein RHGRI_031826 [Rhododendron griersonianum]
MADPVILRDLKQLRKLALLIHNQEEGAISKIKFKSEPDRAKYLRDIRENYESVLGLLNDGAEVKRKFDQDHDDTRTPIAHEIFMYVVHFTNRMLQYVRNYTLRTSYLSKVREHSKSLIKRLSELNPRDLASVEDLTEELVVFNNAALESMRKRQSPASRSFSQWLEGTGLNPDKLVIKAQEKLGFKGPFKDLKEEEKLQVYEKILLESGHGGVVEKWLTRAVGAAGMAVLVFTAGMMVWDILSSEHPFQTASRDAVETAASVGGGMLGEVIGDAVATELLAGVEVSPLFVTFAGVVGGIGGVFIFGAFAGWLIDLIIHSGGSAEFSTEGHQCFVARMPDGVALARQIAAES